MPVEGVALRLGATAADPLLDYLQTASDRTSRARAMSVLIAIGPGVLPAAAARFAQAPWYVQRNILVLHRALSAWPAGFSPISCTVHPPSAGSPRGVKLLLNFPQHRTSALSHGLRDADDGIVQLVLLAALGVVSPRGVQGGRAIPRCRSPVGGAPGSAVRVVARASRARALPGWSDSPASGGCSGGWRLAAKSPIVLAALGALASTVPRTPRRRSSSRWPGSIPIRTSGALARRAQSDPVRFLTAFSQALSTLGLYGDEHPATSGPARRPLSPPRGPPGGLRQAGIHLPARGGPVRPGPGPGFGRGWEWSTAAVPGRRGAARGQRPHGRGALRAISRRPRPRVGLARRCPVGRLAGGRRGHPASGRVAVARHRAGRRRAPLRRLALAAQEERDTMAWIYREVGPGRRSPIAEACAVVDRSRSR